MTVRWALLACAIGCNQVLGIRHTRPLDGPPIDAPFACPQLGTMAPRFAPGVHGIPAGECAYYTTNGTRAVAVCGGAQPIYEGPIDAQLAPAVGVAGPATSQAVDHPHLTSEGDELLVQLSTDTTAKISFYRRQSDGTWAHDYDPAITLAAGDMLGSLTGSAASRRIVIQLVDGSYHEYVSDGGTGWTAGPVHSLAELGVETAGIPALTSDALRLVFSGRPIGAPVSVLLYSDRNSATEPFHTAVPLQGVPGQVPDPFLTDDCARLYFSASDVESVFYAQQQ